eukprot:8682140-Lingulodinium_polyedra.AAC.1
MAARAFRGGGGTVARLRDACNVRAALAMVGASVLPDDAGFVRGPVVLRAGAEREETFSVRARP